MITSSVISHRLSSAGLRVSTDLQSVRLSCVFDVADVRGVCRLNVSLSGNVCIFTAHVLLDQLMYFICHLWENYIRMYQ